MNLPELNHLAVTNLVRAALAEDLGSGDATTLAVVPAGLPVSARLCCREACVVAGMPLVVAVFAELDPEVAVTAHVAEGEPCPPGRVLATIRGPARAILSGERTALNYLQRLTGIATLTAAYVRALGGSPTKLLDTRKTTPGLRLLEKYAVAAGGGRNHRLGLYDMIMIKDNHRELAALDGPGGIARAVAACRRQFPRLKVEVEADAFEQACEAMAAGADFVLLDNMSDEQLSEIVRERNDHYAQTQLEASGGITLERLPALAGLGLDYISVGALTHSARATDIGLDIDVASGYPDTP